ncbi:MAG: hypothetical protein AAF512_22390 [Pseudomonadota bacterium]
MSMDISDETLLDMHHRMVRIRIFEEEAGKMMTYCSNSVLLMC